MAIVGGDDELENPNNPQGANSAGGGSYAGGGGAAAATTKAASPDGTSSGGYTNLTNYLQANQGAAATTGKAAENVVDQAGNASNAANATLGANGASEPVGATVDQGVLGAIKGGIGSGVGGKTTAGGQSGAMASAYKGPNDVTGVTGYGDAAKAINTLSGYDPSTPATKTPGGLLKNTDGSMEGTSALLNQAYQQPSYSKGENTLDSFLVNGAPSSATGLTAVQQANKDWSGQDQSYQGLLDKIGGGITNAKAQTGQVQGVYDAAKADANAQTDKNNTAWTVQDTANKKAAADKAAADKAAADKAAADKAAAAAAGAVTKTPPKIANTSINNNVPTAQPKVYQGFTTPAAPAAPAASGGNPGGSSPIIDPGGTTPGQTNNPIINHAVGVAKKKLGFAHGGEIPSYEKLLRMVGK